MHIKTMKINTTLHDGQDIVNYVLENELVQLMKYYEVSSRITPAIRICFFLQGARQIHYDR